MPIKEQSPNHGAKVLVAGNDISMASFVQEYTKTALDLLATKNTDFKRDMRVYIVPYQFNSISAFLASREPLYRQNVFQFFSSLNPAYSNLVMANGNVHDHRSMEPDLLSHHKKLFERVVQNYLKEARRSFDLKVFSAKIYYKGRD